MGIRGETKGDRRHCQPDHDEGVPGSRRGWHARRWYARWWYAWWWWWRWPYGRGGRLKKPDLNVQALKPSNAEELNLVHNAMIFFLPASRHKFESKTPSGFRME